MYSDAFILSSRVHNISRNSCYHSTTEQGSEKEVTLGNSLKQLEKDYEESSFESDSDDLNESEIFSILTCIKYYFTHSNRICNWKISIYV